jgi:hypothetical protein
MKIKFITSQQLIYNIHVENREDWPGKAKENYRMRVSNKVTAVSFYKI